METQITHILKTPLKIAKGGDELLAYKLILSAPTAKNREHLIRLKQTFFKAISLLRKSEDRPTGDDVAQSTSKDKEETLEGSQIITMLYMSGVDMVEFQNIFRNLLLQRLATVEDIPLTSYLMDQIDQDEFEEIIGEYISSFLLSSWTGILK